MITIRIYKNGTLTNGQDFNTEILAKAWIDKQEAKRPCSWGRVGVRPGFNSIPAITEKWYRISTFSNITDQIVKLEGGYEVSSTNGDIIANRIKTDMGRTYIEVNVKAGYTLEIVDLDQNVAHLKQKKQQAIQTVRNNFQDKIDDTYDAMKVSILNAKAIQKLGEATQLSEAFVTMASTIDTATGALAVAKLCVKAIEKLALAQNLPNTFENMMLVLDPLFIWRNTTVTAIEACTSVTELEAISLIPPSE